jgi:pimeloyl-ACP methyl ester carboxylesterase
LLPARLRRATRALAAAGLAAAVWLCAGCASLGDTMTHAALDAERWRAGVDRRELTLPDGTRIAYLDGGSGEPLVLVHGFGADKDNFTRVARWLVPHYRVIAPDLVGFGESTHLPDADYRYAAQAARLHDFVRALGLKRVHLGGNSMGGGIVLSYAAQHPDEVGSLWLIDAAGLPEAPPSELRRLIETTGTNPLLVDKESDFPRLVAFVMSEPPWIPGFAMDAMARERMANAALERKVFAQIATDSVSDAITGLPAPTLITWGAQDRALDVGTAALLHAKLPNSRVDVMPGIGHAPMIERPERSARDYLRFRAEMTPPPAAAPAAAASASAG